MSSQIAKNKYLYFYCLGQKRQNGCGNQYILANELEKDVETLYKTIQLPEELAEKTIENLKVEIAKKQKSAVTDRERLTKNLTKLNNQKLKLMEAYYDSAITRDILKIEQQRITDEISKIEEQIRSEDADLKGLEDLLETATRLASNCSLAYQKASEKTKRMFNQTFFKRICVKDKRIEKADYSDFFDLILNKSSDKDNLVGVTGFDHLQSLRSFQGLRP